MIGNLVLAMLLGGLLAVIGDCWIEAEPLRILPRLIGWAGLIVAAWSLVGVIAVATIGASS